MLDKKLISEIAEEKLSGSALFLVEVKVSKTNVVTVVLDGDEGVKVEDCIEMSRYIESKLDRDKEDFELTVMSFGLEEYFTLNRQFVKNVGRDIELTDKDGEKIMGILSFADAEKVIITTKKDKEGRSIPFENIEKARVLINFNNKRK